MTSRVRTRIRDTDKGAHAYARELGKVSSTQWFAGITEASGSEVRPNGLTTLDVAAIHEFGQPGQPATPFIRGIEEDSEVQRVAREAAEATAKYPDQAQAQLMRVAETAAARIRTRIKELELVDTGSLEDSVVAELR